MNREQVQFFALLRSGLWNVPADSELFSDHTDWEAIFIHATQQTVQGIVAVAASTLPVDMQPPVSIMNKARSVVTATIRTHALMNRTLSEAVTMLRLNGINPVLLKGQGVADNYVEPTVRMCGDIDLYIGKQDYHKACELAKQWGETAEKTTESEKHYHFCHGGVAVEFHRIAERLPMPWHDSRFQRWTQKHLQGNSLRSVNIEDTAVSLPPVNFDALYIFNHAWNHFIMSRGIGWRQLCDWVRYLHTFRDEINLSELEKDLRSFGLWHPWRMFGPIAVGVLGLPKQEYPFYTDRYARRAADFVDMIEEGGNFGFFNHARTQRPEGYILGKAHSLRMMSRRYIKLLVLCPEKVPAACSRYLYAGVRQVIRDIFT